MSHLDCPAELGLSLKYVASSTFSSFHTGWATVVKACLYILKYNGFGQSVNKETYHMPEFQPLTWSYIRKTQHSFKLIHNIGVCVERRGRGEPKTNKLFLQIWWKVHGPNSFAWNPVIFTSLLKIETSQIVCGLCYCCEQLLWSY